MSLLTARPARSMSARLVLETSRICSRSSSKRHDRRLLLAVYRRQEITEDAECSNLLQTDRETMFRPSLTTKRKRSGGEVNTRRLHCRRLPKSREVEAKTVRIKRMKMYRGVREEAEPVAKPEAQGTLSKALLKTILRSANWTLASVTSN